MPNYTADVNPNALFAKKPTGGSSSMSENTTENTCSCGCQDGSYYPYWIPGNYPPPPCPPVPPTPPQPEPTPLSPEGQMIKLTKKKAIIKKMIEGLTNKEKDMIIQIANCGTYNFGSYYNDEDEITEYGAKVLEILEAELLAIKDKIDELNNSLDDDEDTFGGIESTVTQ